MVELVATGFPLMYMVAVAPDSVTARWVQVFTGSWPLLLSCCSPPLPPVVMANRGPAPALTVRNMYTPVPVPMSNTRDHCGVAAGLTQVEMVKSDSPLTIPVGRLTYSLLPLSLTALPSLPGTRGPVACWPPPGSVLVTGPLAQRLVRIDCWIASAMPFI